MKFEVSSSMHSNDMNLDHVEPIQKSLFSKDRKTKKKKDSRKRRGSLSACKHDLSKFI